MKTFVKGILLTGALTMATNGLFAAQANNANNGWFEQWHKAKYGRPSPSEEARLKAEGANTAFREEFAPDVGPANTWFNDFYRAKYGRPAPNEEATLNAEREEATPTVARPADTWLRGWHKAKHGHVYPPPSK